MKRPSAIVVGIALAAMLTAPAFAEKRVALVIGNGAYAASPLANPPNDAKDMAALFRSADMDVVERSNLDLAGMEKAVSDFVKLLKGADSAVVYYAGHGVQVGGENYLVPVRETVGSEAQVRSRSMAVSDLLERIKGTGVKTIILFLDACRDNPFPGSSRSAARGLSVVPTVAEVETVVAFATEPGKTAADGGGRNGVFTAALLKNLAQPGLSIAEAMIQVRADVLAATGGEQQPRLDLGLSRPWYLVDPAVAAAKAKAAATESQAQLAALDKEMADRQARIAAAKDAASREALELEQRKQEAARAAKQLEAESLARTAELRRQAADAEARKQEQVQASVRAQEELSAAMAKRRAELEKLGAQGSAADPDAMVDTVERLKAAITEIEGQFESSWSEAERGIRSGFDPLFAVLAKAEPELWETDAEYERRKAADRGKLDADMAGTLANRKAALDAELKKQTATLAAQLATALKALEAKTWTVPSAQVRVTVGDYDRNTRLWPVSVTSLDPAVEAAEQFVIDFNKSKDIKTELVAFDRAVKAGALAGEVGWGIRPDPANSCYLVVIKTITLRNLESGKAVASSAPGKALAYFYTGRRGDTVSLTKARVEFSVQRGDVQATVYLNGTAIGTTPLSGAYEAGTADVRYVWPDGMEWRESARWSGGERYLLSPAKPRAYRNEVWIPGGSFPMGSTDGNSDEKPVHTVTVSGFWMMKTEVTQGDYRELMGSNPSNFKGDSLPVEHVSWYDAIAYANALSKKDGLTPAYTINGTSVSLNQSASGWRLPTEAEWEYAAKGGPEAGAVPVQAKWAGSSDIGRVAWYKDNSGNTTHPVGTKAANAAGLYDMAGNVWEWCWDRIGDYNGGSQTDPAGASSGYSRVLRGGGWRHDASRARSASRIDGHPTYQLYDLGFRLVRPPVR